MNKILITGGAGFIGTSLILRLINDNKITVFDNLERNALKDEEVFKHPNLKLIVGNILDKSSLDNCFPVDIVIHLASLAGVDNVISRPDVTMRVNMIGTDNVLNASLESNVKRFIHYSTSEVYGSYTYRLDENECTSLGAVGEARWSYAVSKLAAEHLAFAFHTSYKLPTVSIRPFNIYGPKQVGEGAIHVFVKKALKNEDIEIHGDGSQIRSWCYIDDAVDFTLLCLDNEKAIGEVLNMGNPAGTITIVGLAKKIIEISGSKSNIKYVKKPFVDVDLRVPSIEKSKQILGWEPKVDLEEGIERTIEWYKKGIYAI